jgi:hypothetical protein
MLRELTEYIRSTYPQAEVARQMCDTINWKFAHDKYDTSLNIDEFAFELTTDLRRVSKDHHIVVTRPLYKPFDESTAANKLHRMTDRQRRKYFEKSRKHWKKFWAEYKKRTKDDMFDYGEIKILPGNVGYAEIKDFGSTSYNKKQNKGRIAVASVMNFFRNTNSIIIDLRDNQGGFIKQAAKFCSYFSPRVHNYFITTEDYFRYDSSGQEKETKFANKMFTEDEVNNSITQSKAIYILVSKRTFSAAELSTYKIKQFNPATTIVGEHTPGGGNGHAGGTADKYFSAIIPCFRVFDEKNSSYELEAKGVAPDVAMSADSAFETAYKLALHGLSPATSRVKYFRKQSHSIDANENYFRKYYPDYVGDYRKIQIVNEGEELVMYLDSYIKMQLLPKAIDNFTAKGIPSIKFLRDNLGRVTEIQLQYSDEFAEHFRRQ